MLPYRYFENIFHNLVNNNCYSNFTLNSILSICIGFKIVLPDILSHLTSQFFYLNNQPCFLIVQLKSNNEGSIYEARR